ncbi:UDP-N-acetylmuramoyl-L-alanyl-D-glutamate--2, 6-diaminopimelate ligase [Candidatus Sulfotelmatobacter kueseliae]|uniref:UDP-N-acetylmuramoyl-L-alanyl-D-glutamate--2,6-diaminopimelate ligase n=1 Tax=Candidatus Sulfotelmatobacter kueseliae TaxID=2042962 RepID=A0A2U3L3J5_9BACT|nr:UDP-N-acetylmuramoyl-L-alanyl-D-glutamate--2, 6-diaminopimelate ligase [Candidatus Sulfotelmatobacter kueseliae]
MTFEHLLDGAQVLARSGNPSVSGVEYDSRRVKPGCGFVAMRGETSDGNRYIDQAIQAGAVAVITDSSSEKPRQGVAWAVVPHGRRALARVSANFYKRPAERIAITGITGTNGKSTTAFLMEAILTAAARKSALIGTIEYHVAGQIYPAPHTTPEALELARLLNEALGQGATDAVMEVSSHALAQQRVFGVPFDVAVFTNLTRDHLDYHKTMDEYFAAKRVLFEGCGTDAPRVAVTNLDDDYGAKLVEFSRKRSSMVLTYGWERGDFHAENVDISPRGTRFDVVTPQEKLAVFSPLIGRVNVYNILAAAAAGYARKCDAQAIVRGVEMLTHVPGRFERVDCGQPFTVVVDYAHTDDALRNLTALAREFVSRTGAKGRVLTVFGCGGDRDRAKRPLMGEAAGRGSDFVVLTSDNPRSEDPVAIINDALVGLQKTGVKYTVEADRRKAVAFAIGEARPGDIVLLAGKGHEKVQVTREGARPFDDVEVAREALRAAGFEKNC